MSETALVQAFERRPPALLVSGAGLLASVALTPAPAFGPLILLVATIFLHTHDVRNGRSGAGQTALLALSVAGGGTVARLGPASSALPSASHPVVILFAFSAIATALAIGAANSALWLGSRYASQSSWHRLVIFPFVWATTWMIVAAWSPVGRLSTWSPLTGYDAYSWTQRYAGSFGLDWIVAAWGAVVAGALAGNEVSHVEPMLVELGDVDPTYGPQPAVAATASKPRPVFLLGLVLAALTIPFTVTSHGPLAPSTNSATTTAVSVACALPPFSQGDRWNNFAAETSVLVNRAKLVLWPEGAVKFDTVQEFEESIKSLQTDVLKNTTTAVGVSFLMPAPLDRGGEGKLVNGLTLVDRDQVYFTYYKRNLVPIAESFHQLSSSNPPPLIEYELKRPKNGPRPPWGGRNVTITAGICLDMAASLPILHHRPALILAPARTWQRDVGLAMWLNAKRRAEELGAEVLWCDGSSEGFSGVTGASGDQLVEVGTGSWAKTIQIPYPYPQRRTPFGMFGEFSGVVIVAVICLGFGAGADWFVARLRLAAQTSPWTGQHTLHVEWADIRALTEPVRARIAGLLHRGGQPDQLPTTATEASPLIDYRD